MASFTTSPSDIKQLICGYLPPHIAIQLSCTDKTTQKALNEQFFERIFYERHPLLNSSHDKAFKDVKPLMPTQFWKVACWALADNDVESLPLALIAKESIPFARQKLEEFRLKAIQESSRFQLLKADFEQATQEYCAFLDQLNASRVTEKEWISSNLSKIQAGCCLSIEQQGKGTNEYFTFMDPEVRSVLKFIYMRYYVGVTNFAQDVCLASSIIAKIVREIDQHPDAFTQACLQFVRGIFARAKTYECAQKDCVIINEVMTLLKGCFLPSGPVQQQPNLPQLDPEKMLLAKDADHIRELINSTGCRRTIWDNLYHNRGNNSSEAQWAENHFREKEHLPVLFYLIQWMSSELTSTINSWNSEQEDRFFLAVQLIQEQIQDFLLHIQPLKKAIQDLDSLIAQPGSLTREKIKEQINSSRLSTQIWSGLYEKCAQGVKEDSWSENHFNEFLPELKEILLNTVHENAAGLPLDIAAVVQNAQKAPAELVTDLRSVLNGERLPSDPRNATQNS